MAKRIFPLLFLLYFVTSCTSNQPFFQKDSDPTPEGKKWVKIEAMSDEFNGKTLDTKKWKNTDPQKWIGRPPAMFKEDAVRLEDGQLKITNYLLATAEKAKGDTFTHASGLVRSKAGHIYGYYECKMKASKTFMSSTFWLINYPAGEGCERRVTELDIQECVGEVTNTDDWASVFDRHMNSNTHHRYGKKDLAGCPPRNSNKNDVSVSGKVYDDFHVYGAWWKNEREAFFYLDGVFQYKIDLPSDFNLPMYLNMVTETYNWNPVPAGNGMSGTEAERTTSYEWVRAWELVEK
ncbi:MAG: family 16 glycosylhydrolase [Bacteroidota bacterium]